MRNRYFYLDASNETSSLPAGSEPLAEAARADARAATSTNTNRAYGADWCHYIAWCRRKTSRAGSAGPRALHRRLRLRVAAARSRKTRSARSSDGCRRWRGILPTRPAIDRKDRHVATVLAGVRRSQGRPPEQKEAVLPEDLLAMIATSISESLRGLRDRAYPPHRLRRRPEAVGNSLVSHCRREDGLSGGWIEFFDEGLLLTLGGRLAGARSNSARGSSEATCPVAALETWLKFARIAVGPLFRRVVGGKVGPDRLTDRHVARLVKHTALAAGVRGDLSEGERETKFSGHSLRAGLASSAEVDERYVQRQLGHASAEMTRRYQQRRRDRFRVNLTKAAGL